MRARSSHTHSLTLLLPLPRHFSPSPSHSSSLSLFLYRSLARTVSQDLSGPSLEEVWALAISAASASAGQPLTLGDGEFVDLARLSESPLNCRQVHQAIRMAVALARREHLLAAVSREHFLGSASTSDCASTSSLVATSSSAALHSSASRMDVRGGVGGQQSGCVLKQLHIEKALQAIVMVTPLGGGGEGKGGGLRKRDKPRAWQDLT